MAARQASWANDLSSDDTASSDDADLVSQTELTEKLRAWLKSVGLAFNPFVPLDAGADSRLSTYLVGHDAFETIWGDWPAILFAPAGGGKSAFRVRLAYACRVGQDGKRVFPIVYHLPAGLLSFEEHLQAICKAAAHELLLELVWRPGWFESLDLALRQEIRQIFDWNAPGLLQYFLPELREEGMIDPIVINYDSSAAQLPRPPAPARIRAFCDALQAIPAATDPPPLPAKRFTQIVELCINKLGCQSVYLLLDSVDAHPQTIQSVQVAFEWLCPLLQGFRDWDLPEVFLKLFLPEELFPLFGDRRLFLTSQTKTNKIKWHTGPLVEMLSSRVLAASKGRFDSLDAISNPELHQVEERLVLESGANPRALLRLAGQVLLNHVRGEKSSTLLDADDVDQAIEFCMGQNKGP